MSSQDKCSADMFEAMVEEVQNSQGLKRLKCKHCDTVFKSYKASELKAHMSSHHPRADTLSRLVMSDLLREEVIRQFVHKPAGIFCISCQTTVPNKTGSSLRFHIQECQHHYVSMEYANAQMDMFLSYTPAGSEQSDFEPEPDSQQPSSFSLTDHAELFAQEMAHFCPFEGCMYSTAYDMFLPHTGAENLYIHLRKKHGKEGLEHGQLRQ